MAITAGSYTVGSGGNYATLYAAITDIGTPLTGNITLTIISNITESFNIDAAGFTAALRGYTLKITSNTPHYGDPTKGWTVTYNTSGTTTAWMRLYPTGNGTVDIGNYKITGISRTTQMALGIYHTTTAVVAIIHDILLDNNFSASSGCQLGIRSIDNANVQKIYNCISYSSQNAATTGFSITQPAAGSIIENCTAFNCDTCFNGGNTNLIFRNCAALSGTTAFSVNTSTLDKCASFDTTGSEASLRSLTALNQVQNMNYYANSFCDILPKGKLWQFGSAPTISGHTKDIRNRNLRNNRGFYSIGACVAWNNQAILSQ